MARISVVNALLGVLLLATAARAQFQFFEHMFGFGGHEEEQEEGGNVPSDSEWYQRTYDGGTCVRNSDVTPRLRLSCSLFR